MKIACRYWLVAGTFLLSVLLYVDRVCISAAKGEISQELQLSDNQMGWVLSAFALGYALLQAPSGNLADRYGPRIILTSVVAFWSLFTGLTAFAWNFSSMLVARFLFGAGEAGAFPGIARAAYSWIPMQERGLVQGINFSGSRIGAAFALPMMAIAIEQLGWRVSFVCLMFIGFAWSVYWYMWFRNDPAEHRGISNEERDYILSHRQSTSDRTQELQTQNEPVRQLSMSNMFSSANLWIVCLQYFCSNFTFYFCLTWLHPYLKKTYQLTSVEAAVYASVPFLCGALGNWLSGWLVDYLYKKGHWRLSRSFPAMLGFLLAAAGILGSVWATTPMVSVVWLSLAVFGADMTLAPSWSFCIDIGRKQAGLVSGIMNMAGNLGSFVTGLAFPYLATWFGSNQPFFYTAAGLNLLAIICWSLLNPRKPLEAT